MPWRSAPTAAGSSRVMTITWSACGTSPRGPCAACPDTEDRRGRRLLPRRPADRLGEPGHDDPDLGCPDVRAAGDPPARAPRLQPGVSSPMPAARELDGRPLRQLSGRSHPLGRGLGAGGPEDIGPGRDGPQGPLQPRWPAPGHRGLGSGRPDLGCRHAQRTAPAHGSRRARPVPHLQPGRQPARLGRRWRQHPLLECGAVARAAAAPTLADILGTRAADLCAGLDPGWTSPRLRR